MKFIFEKFIVFSYFIFSFYFLIFSKLNRKRKIAKSKKKLVENNKNFQIKVHSKLDQYITTLV